jgi:MFS family permease
LVLLTIVVGINYIDRGNLATAAPLIQNELRVSATQLGLLMSSFYWTYVLMHIPAGWLAERYGAHRVLAGGVTLWSIATALTSVAGTFGTLLALRLLLGVGESVYFPCNSKLIATEVDIRHRAMANGLIGFGIALGPAVGTYVGGELTAMIGWRPVFAVFGIVPLLWLVPWWRFWRTRSSAARTVSARVDCSPTLREIVCQRALWGASLGHLAVNYTTYFVLSWLPFYLVKVRGFSIAAMAGIVGFAYLLNAVGSLASGWGTDRLIRGGVSANLVYKVTMAITHAGSMIVIFGIFVAGPVAAIASLCIYQLLNGILTPGVGAIGQTLAGPHAAGRWMGVQNMIGNLAGIAAPLITGIIVDTTGSFFAAFILAAGINILGLVGWLALIARVEPVRWEQPNGSRDWSNPRRVPTNVGK